jgi:hypothetical protein
MVLVGCSQARSEGIEVDLVMVSWEQERVKVTYLEHNLLNTVRLEGALCEYDIGKARLVRSQGQVMIEPNGACVIDGD